MNPEAWIETLQVSPLIETDYNRLQRRMDLKLKPVGSLGKLEHLAIQLALILGDGQRIQAPELFLFAADHGIAEQGVSVAPQAVTALMVHQFVAGKAAINSLCEVNQVKLTVIDAGIAQAIQEPQIIHQAIARGTADFSKEAAMSIAQAQQAISAGQALVSEKIVAGCDCVLLGEMGIGNTSAATAIMAALSHHEVRDCVGDGTGITTETFQRKQALIERALARLPEHPDPLLVLAEVGGFEMAQMVGAIIAAAQHHKPVVIDGFICSASALVAVLLAPNVKEFMIFAHQSNERAHGKLLALLDAEPLLHLKMRLGEGSGAVLAMPLIHSAQACFYQMGSLSDVGITG